MASPALCNSIRTSIDLPFGAANRLPCLAEQYVECKPVVKVDVGFGRVSRVGLSFVEPFFRLTTPAEAVIGRAARASSPSDP